MKWMRTKRKEFKEWKSLRSILKRNKCNRVRISIWMKIKVINKIKKTLSSMMIVKLRNNEKRLKYKKRKFQYNQHNNNSIN